MLQKKSWRSIGFLLFMVIGILAFSAVIFARFHQANISSPTSSTQETTEHAKADLLPETDKIELSQTELIAVEPSKAVTTAERAMPPATESTYQSACQKLKELYMTENASKLADEQKRYQAAQQAIINKYSSANLSFSTKQKAAQSLETKRHDFILGQLGLHLKNQLKSISC